MSTKFKLLTDDEAAVIDSQMDTLSSAVTKAGTTAREAADALKALCEVMNVDPYAMKEQMVINALKNDGKGYPGDLYTDAIEVIATLRRERDDYKRMLKDANSACVERYDAYEQEMKWRMEREARLDSARNLVNNQCYYILGKFPDKRRYTKDDMMAAQVEIVNQLGDHHRKIIKILTEETKQQ